ncbi:MAG: valine--tRNA ligase [Nanoarchaeota archaeon]
MQLKDIKNWSAEIEKPIAEEWKKSERFNFNAKSKKKTYSIDTPPPYVNAPIHIGQAITYCYMDFFARYKRMKGNQVIFPLGLDNNGLPIEISAEKKFNISALELGRDKFIELCKKLLDEAGTETQDTFSKLGISFTSYKEGDHIGAVYKTDSPEFRKLTQATFIDLFKKGLVFEDIRINNWDTKLQTTIADSEIEYKDIPSTFNFVKWKVKETKEEIIIATTRPELICTCGMVIFNPEDKRYKHLENKTVISPLFGKEIKIKSHPIAQIDKGTGLVMMCSAGDLSDIQFFREQNLKPVIAINKNGTMNENAGFLKGLKIKDARLKIICELKEKNLLIKQENILHRTPVSERSGAEIEFIEMPEFYLKQIEFKKEMKKISDEINFYPEESKKILIDWIESVSIEWPISRRRFYATPIPIWHAKDDENMVALGKEGKYHEPWKVNPEKDFEVYKNGKKLGFAKDFNKEWIGETRVFDTWMDSSISELYMIKYRQEKDFFDKSYPVSLRPQGKEIIRTWLYYTLLRGYLETSRSCFNDVWINQHIVDENGLKMSKSKGNVISPQKLLKDYGGEAIRFWSAIEGDLSKQDLKCSEERIKAELKTINKILNISKFVFLFEKPIVKQIADLDQLFIDYIEDLTSRTEESYEKYDFYHPAIELRKFVWDLFASHYIEVIKSRAYNQENKFTKQESDSAKYTLYYLLERLLTLIYPILPMLSGTIANEIKIDLFSIEFPKSKKGKSNLKLIESLVEFNSLIWKIKKEKGISLRNEISGIKIPIELKKFEKDLISAHNLVN